MSTFNLPKDVGDIQEPELMPEDWYPFVVSTEPKEDKNNVAKEQGEDAPGAGTNIVINLSCLSEDPRFAGRPFTMWLPLPNPSDEGKYTRAGQKMEDWKMARIVEVASGLAGTTVGGSDVDMSEGMTAEFYINQGLDRAGKTIVNNLDLFAGVRPIGSGPTD